MSTEDVLLTKARYLGTIELKGNHFVLQRYSEPPLHKFSFSILIAFIMGHRVANFHIACRSLFLLEYLSELGILKYLL